MTVVAVGAAGVDVIATTERPPVAGQSTPGRIRISAGGAARNVAENLARLGTAVRLLAAVDASPLSDLALERTAQAGVDVGGVIHVRDRGNVYAAIGSAGRLRWAVSDMTAAEALRPEDLDAHDPALRAARAVVVDANLVPATIRRAAALAAGSSLCLLATSPAKAVRLRDVFPGAALLVLTAEEAAALTAASIASPPEALRAAQTLRVGGPATVVITMGEQGMGWVGAAARWVAPLPAPVVDPSGAGDAVAAVAVYALLAGIDEARAARLAAAAAAMTVTVEGATHPELSLDALSARA